MEEIKEIISKTNSAVNFTKSQQRFINEEGSNIIVSAGAGSGKTTSMTQKIIGLIEGGADLNKIVVLTFTKSAANDMKAKIRRQLLRLNKGKLILELEGARIGTIHSFLLSVIKEYSYGKIPFNPDFSPLDDSENMAINEIIFNRLVTRLRKKMSAEERKFILRFSKINNLGNIKEMLFAFEKFLEKVEDQEDFLNKCVSNYFSDTENVRKNLLDYFAFKCSKIISVGDKAKNETFVSSERDHLFLLNDKVYFDNFVTLDEKNFKVGNEREKRDNYISLIKELHVLISRLSNLEPENLTKINETYEKILGFDTSVRGTKTHIESINKNLLNTLGFITYLNSDILGNNQGNIKTLGSLYKEFRELKEKEKNSRKRISFYDIEKFALALLGDDEVRKAVKDSITHMFIDEYQDTSYIQEKIFSLIKPDINFFCIGDIKQSIYRFRNAEAVIFNNRLNSYLDSKGNDKVIPFNENFRSTKEIIDFINIIFSNLMTKNETGSSIDYKAKSPDGFNLHKLKFPENSPKENGVKPEILIPEIKDENVPKDEKKEIRAEFESIYAQHNIKTAIELEAHIVASIIFKMLREENYSLSDFTVIARTNKALLVFNKIFRNLGIPSNLKEVEDIFSSPEVLLLFEMLKVISGDENDISILAFLKSDLFEITDSDLIKIRENSHAKNLDGGDLDKSNKHNKNEDFFTLSNIDALLIDDIRGYSVDGEDESLRAKVTDFLDKLNSFKNLSDENTLVNFLNKFLIGSDFLETIYGSEGNIIKTNNIEKFISLATNYSENNISDLTGFINFVEVIRDKGISVNASNIFHKESEKVNLTTIHSSKGLEYNVLFFVNTGSKITRPDLTNYTFSKQYGPILPFFVDEDKKFISNPLNFIDRNIDSLDENEEIKRLLYVALTRAKNRLFMLNFSFKNSTPSYYNLITDNLCDNESADKKPSKKKDSSNDILKKYQRVVSNEELKKLLDLRTYKSKKDSFNDVLNSIKDAPVDKEKEERYTNLIETEYGYPLEINLKPKLSVSEILNQKFNEETKILQGDEDEDLFENSYKEKNSDEVALDFKNGDEDFKSGDDFKNSDADFKNGDDDPKNNSEEDFKSSGENFKNGVDLKNSGDKDFKSSGDVVSKGNVGEKFVEDEEFVGDKEFDGGKNIKPSSSKMDSDYYRKKGTIMHDVFSKLILTNNNLDELFKNKLLNEKDKEYIDEKSVSIFLNSDLYKKAKRAKNIFSETVFTASIDDTSLHSLNETGEIQIEEKGKDYDGNTLIQGVFDLYFIDEKEEITLVDFKSSKINIEKSFEQLRIYRGVLESIYDKKVKTSQIYIFSTGEVVNLEG